jgi:hypothetical protein
MDADRTVTAADNDPFLQSVVAGRLRRLGDMGLAEDLGHGRWQFVGGLEDTLRRMGERGDIIRTMQRELTARRLGQSRTDRVIDTEIDRPIVGRLLHRGFSDEHRDRHYLMIDGVDGRVHYLDIGRGDAAEPLAENATLRVTARSAGIRPVDRTVAEIATANDGRYSVDLHLRHDSRATEAFAQSHVRRLEALRRAGAGVDREPDGSWRVAGDHLGRVSAYETRQLRDRPVEVETLSSMPVANLARLEAATWLDRDAAAHDTMPIRDAGFGAEVRAVIANRQTWLVEQDLADADPAGRIRLRANALLLLQRRELAGAGEEIGRAIGKTYVETRDGDRIEGRIARRVDLQSGRFALVEKSREFTLVPWKPVLERQLGKTGAGLMRGDGVNWHFGRSRGGPEIS